MDLINLIDEVESMRATERRELMSRLEVLLSHLLKWQYQLRHRSSGWLNTIEEQRIRISDHLKANPSLANPDLLNRALTKAYRYAALSAKPQTSLAASIFPAQCLYSFESILDEGFLPDCPIRTPQCLMASLS